MTKDNEANDEKDESEETLSPEDLMAFAWQISQGMVRHFEVKYKHGSGVFYHFRTLRKELKIRPMADYCWQTSRCLVMWCKIVLSVWYISSIKTKAKEKRSNKITKSYVSLRSNKQRISRSWFPLFELNELLLISLNQEIIKVREWIPHICPLTKVIRLKLFLDIVPSSCEDITRAMRGQPKRLTRNYLRKNGGNVIVYVLVSFHTGDVLCTLLCSREFRLFFCSFGCSLFCRLFGFRELN